LWEFDTGGPVGQDLAVDAVGVYVVTDEPAPRLRALAPTDGRTRWEVPLTADHVTAPALGGGAVFAAAGFCAKAGAWSAIDTRTGHRRWSVPGGAGEYWALRASDRHLFTTFRSCGGSSTLAALDTKAGGKRWEFAMSESRDHFEAHDDVVFARGADRCLHARDADTGRPRWATPKGLLRAGGARVRDGLVYVDDGETGAVHALDTRTGGQRWVDAAATNMRHVLLVGDTLYVCGAARVVALDAATGARRWSTGADVPGRHWWPLRPLAVDAGLLLVATGSAGALDEEDPDGGGGVVALDPATGARRWWYEAGGHVASAVVPVPGTLCALDSRGRVHALNSANGQRRWWYGTGHRAGTGLATLGGVVFGGTSGKRVFALRA